MCHRYGQVPAVAVGFGVVGQVEGGAGHQARATGFDAGAVGEQAMLFEADGGQLLAVVHGNMGAGVVVALQVVVGGGAVVGAQVQGRFFKGIVRVGEAARAGAAPAGAVENGLFVGIHPAAGVPGDLFAAVHGAAAGRAVREHHDVLVPMMLEKVVDAVLGQQAGDERQIAVVVLHAVAARGVLVLQPELAQLGGDAAVAKDRAHDLLGGLVLENAPRRCAW